MNRLCPKNRDRYKAIQRTRLRRAADGHRSTDKEGNCQA